MAGNDERERAGGLERLDFDTLETCVARDPGAPEFPALAEAHRRAGRAEQARRVSEDGLAQAPLRMAGRVSLGLALLDLGEPERARDALAGILDTLLETHRLPAETSISAVGTDEARVWPEPPSPEALDTGAEFAQLVDESEIELAFAEARSEPERMHSPNEMAEDVLRAQPPEIDAGPSEPIPFDDECEPTGGASSEAFKTRTMAALLEEQGDHAGARLIRDQLGESTRPGVPMDAAALPESGGETELGSAERRARGGRILATLETWLQNLARGTA